MSNSRARSRQFRCPFDESSRATIEYGDRLPKLPDCACFVAAHSGYVAELLVEISKIRVDPKCPPHVRDSFIDAACINEHIPEVTDEDGVSWFEPNGFLRIPQPVWSLALSHRR